MELQEAQQLLEAKEAAAAAAKAEQQAALATPAADAEQAAEKHMYQNTPQELVVDLGEGRSQERLPGLDGRERQNGQSLPQPRGQRRGQAHEWQRQLILHGCRSWQASRHDRGKRHFLREAVLVRDDVYVVHMHQRDVHCQQHGTANGGPQLEVRQQRRCRVSVSGLRFG